MVTTHSLPVYLNDTRQDMGPGVPKYVQELAKAVAIMIPKEFLVEEEDHYRLKFILRLESSYDLCEGERFANQFAPGLCSGFIVGQPNHLITSAHCLEKKSLLARLIPQQKRRNWKRTQHCKNFLWVTGWDLQMMKENRIPKGNVFQCKSILNFTNEFNKDFTLIELDKSIEEVPPLQWATSAGDAGDIVLSLSYPMGIPLKFDGGGRILPTGVFGNQFFLASIDTFHGSSGSPVFNVDGEVLGILTKGQEDFETIQLSEEKSCQKIVRCQDLDPKNNCKGEYVLKSEVILKSLNQAD